MKLRRHHVGQIRKQSRHIRVDTPQNNNFITTNTMWGLNAGLAWLVASTQLPFNTEPTKPFLKSPAVRSNFSLVEGKDVLSPKKMLELPRPGSGFANPAGDLALATVRQYNFDADK